MTGAVRLVPLGGLGEIGLNLLVVEWRPDPSAEATAAIVVDCGVMFPGLDTPGVDLLIPDLTHLRGLGDRLLGVVLTHGHEDHIGALPFLLREQNVPVYGGLFTLGLVEGKLAEHRLLAAANLVPFEPRVPFQLGPFTIEPLHMTHSIADAAGLAIHTPVGTIIHTGDFKIDHTPVDGRVSDLERLATLGREGVLCLLSDSTNADRPGTTPSERAVAPALDRVFRETPGKVVTATFSSHVHRIQQILEGSARHGRKTALVGRSLVQNVAVARRLGRLDVPEGQLIAIDDVSDLPPAEVTVISTGSQGEPRSALSRIAAGDHPEIELLPGDSLVLSSRVIPGNERPIANLVNHAFRRGANVIREGMLEIHTSGHASQDELRLVLRLTRPRFFVPVHGEYRHLVRHIELARETGVPDERCYLLEDGETLALDEAGAWRDEPVKAGRVFVDGKGVGDVEEVVLRDRLHLASDGVVLAILAIERSTGEIVSGPDLVSRGFVLPGAHQALLDEARTRVIDAVTELAPEARSEPAEVQEIVRRTLKRFFSKRLDRRPMILPFVLET